MELGEVAPTSTEQIQRKTRGSTGFLLVGVLLLAVVAVWWAIGLFQTVPQLSPGRADVDGKKFTTVPIMPFAGLDFHHNYVGVRSWKRGDDLYREMGGDPANPKYTYPPTTLVAFSWTAWFPPSLHLNFNSALGAFPFEPSFPAMFVWLTMIIVVVAAAAWRSWLFRTELGLPSLPLLFILGATFASYPVIFEMERGNCNALPLLAIFLLVPALRWQRQWLGDVFAGLCVACAVGVKPFAIVLVLGLVAVRRARAAGLATVWLGVFCVVMWRDLVPWLEVAKVSTAIQQTGYLEFSHSLISHWPLLMRDVGLPQLASWPPTVMVGGGMLIVALVVSWRVFKSGEPRSIAWPYLLWLAAIATFVSPVAQDYNLLFVPLVILGVWRADDSWWSHLCVCLALIWWQPFYFGLSGFPWHVLKAVSVVWVGWLVLARLEPRGATSFVMPVGNVPT